MLSLAHWQQISSAATSVQLAEYAYSSFYRTVPADDVQAEALIWLCSQFDWHEVVVLYFSKPYGVYLANEIDKRGDVQGIKVHTVSYVDDILSKQNAAERIKRLNTYIIIHIFTGTVEMMFDILEAKGVLTFPYYYIGVDSWFQSATIKELNTQRYTKGFIGLSIHLLLFMDKMVFISCAGTAPWYVTLYTLITSSNLTKR